ncbi:MAG: agmatinase, partial [Xanthomonadales bacterium]|nr:agmatinase [Xanthomonadales bacterium]
MSIEKLCKNDVALIGIMSDENSSFLRGAAAAPGFIRKALHCGSANLCSELGVDLAGNPRFVDVGDRKIARGDDNFLSIESEICTVLATGALPLVLGGDHSISYPVLRAVYR